MAAHPAPLPLTVAYQFVGLDLNSSTCVCVCVCVCQPDMAFPSDAFINEIVQRCNRNLPFLRPMEAQHNIGEISSSTPVSPPPPFSSFVFCFRWGRVGSGGGGGGGGNTHTHPHMCVCVCVCLNNSSVYEVTYLLSGCLLSCSCC